MSYEWLNGVDSSINFGNNNPNNQYGSNFNSYLYANSSSPQPVSQNSGGRPLPPIPHTASQPQIYPNYANNVSVGANQLNREFEISGNTTGNGIQRDMFSSPNTNSYFPSNFYGGNTQGVDNPHSSPPFQQPDVGNQHGNNSFDNIYKNQFFNHNLAPNNNNYKQPVSSLNETETKTTVFSNSPMMSSQDTIDSGNNTSRPQLSSTASAPNYFTPNYDKINYDQTLNIFGNGSSNGSHSNSAANLQTKGAVEIKSSKNPFRQMMQPKISPVSSAFGNSAVTAEGGFDLKRPLIIPNELKKIASQIPLALAPQLLSSDEIKNYKRWFDNILSKKHLNSNIRLSDIFEFLKNNFAIPDRIKEQVYSIFEDIKHNIGLDNFYAILRCLVLLVRENGKLPSPNLLVKSALPLLKPRPILAKNEDKEEVYEEVADDATNAQPLDFDNFASLLMTGKSHRVKRVVKRNGNRVENKNVRFSDQLVTYEDEQTRPDEDTMNEFLQAKTGNDPTPLDFALPMDQLLRQLEQKKETLSESQEEKEELADMQESLTHFKNLPKIDTVSFSMNGSIPHGNFQNFQQFQQQQNSQQPLQPTATGSANYFADRANVDSNKSSLQPLQPTATGSANRLFSNHNNNAFQQQQPDSFNQQPMLQPTATGSANHLFSNTNANDRFNTGFSNTTPNVSFNNNAAPANNVAGNNHILGDLKSIQDQIDFISKQMYGKSD